MELQDYLIDCTVRVETASGFGTGFFIAPGLVVVPANVVENTEGGGYPLLGEIRILYRGGVWTGRTIRYAASPNPDLAILQTDAGPHRSAFLYAPVRPDDRLFVSSFSRDGGADAMEGFVFEGAERRGSLLGLKPGSIGAAMQGSPVLNLRTGGVCGIVRTSPSGGPPVSATPVSVLDTLFPGIRDSHDRYHEEHPGWFEASGVVGTAIVARTHLQAMRVACQEAIQALLTPDSRATGSVDLMAPVSFRVLTGDGVQRRLMDLSELALRSGSGGPGIMIVGPSGSGRSSLLRFLGHTAAVSARNLGTREHSCLFPILVRANQLAEQGGSLEALVLNAIRKSGLPAAATFLPSTFLSDLVEDPRLRLLIMIDGVDEIQNSRDLAEVIDIIGRIQKESAFGQRTRLVVTSRPSAAEHFRYSGFDVYEVQPLDPASIEIAARRWLRAQADSFLKSSSGLIDTGLVSSPLALSVALALYQRNAGPLPARLVDLYGAMVRLSVGDWSDSGLAEKYGADVVDNAVDAMGFLALELLRSATVQDRPWLLQTAARYFMQRLKADQKQAAGLAERFAEFAGEDSLFLRSAGDRLYWTHQSFQDYFAALRLTASEHEKGNAVKAIRSRWFDANRGSAPRFATAMLSDDEERSLVVAEILSSGREERFDFVSRLIVEGTILPHDHVARLIADLVIEAHQQREDYGDQLRPSARASFAFDLLLSLRHIPVAWKALGGIAVEADWPGQIREQARAAIAVLKGRP